MKNVKTNPPHIKCNDSSIITLKTSLFGTQTYTSPTDGLLTVGNNKYDGANHEYTAKLSLNGSMLKAFCGTDMRVTHAIVELSVTENNMIADSSGFFASPDNLNGIALDKVVEIGSEGKICIDVTKIIQSLLDGNKTERDIYLVRHHALDKKNDFLVIATEKNKDANKRPCLRMDFVSSRLDTEDMAHSTASAGRAGSGRVNLQTGRLVWEHPDMSVRKNGAKLDISHVYDDWVKGVTYDRISTGEKTPEFGCGKRFKLNIQQHLLKAERAFVEGGQSYVYIDGNGNHHDFTDKYYYVDDGGQKHYVALSDCEDNIDGILTHNGKKIERSTENVSGMKLDINSDALGLALRLPATNTHYYTVLADGTLNEIHSGQMTAPEIFRITEYADEPKINLGNRFDIAEIEQYKNSVKNCQSAINNLNIQISCIKTQIQHYQNEMFSIEQKYNENESYSYDDSKLYNEYEAQAHNSMRMIYLNERQKKTYEQEKQKAEKKFKEAVANKKREPIDFITDTDGTVLGFDCFGRLVLVSDGENSAALILYDADGELKSVADKDGNELVKFEYKDGLLESMTDDNGNALHFTYSDGALTIIKYADGEQSSFEYSDTLLSKATGIAFDSAVFTRQETTSKVSKITEQSALARVYSTGADKGNVLKLSEISIQYSNLTTVVNDVINGSSKRYIFDLTGRPVTVMNNRDTGAVSTAMNYYSTGKVFCGVHDDKTENLLVDGDFVNNGQSWGLPPSASFKNVSVFKGAKAVDFVADSTVAQTVDANSHPIEKGMYMLSAWAKARAYNTVGNRRQCSYGEDILGAREEGMSGAYKRNRMFCISAEVMSGTTLVAKYVSSFDSYNQDWQCTSLPIYIDGAGRISAINVKLSYMGNDGAVQFTKCSLIRCKDYVMREYNEDGRLESERTEDGLYIYAYIDGRLAETTFIDNNDILFNAEYKYDGKGRPIFVKDFGGSCRQTFFDDSGNVTREETFNIKDPTLKYVNEYEYDKHGNVISQSTPLGGKTESVYRNGVKTEEKTGDSITAYGHNELTGAVAGISGDADGEENANKLTYNKDFLTKASHNGFEVAYEYDGKGRILKTSVAGYTAITNKYTDASEAGGDSTVTSTFYDNAEDSSVQIGITTDNRGNVKTVIDQATEIPLIQNAYDEEGNLIQKVDGFADITYAYTYTDGKVSGASYSLHGESVEVKKTFNNTGKETGSSVKIGSITRSVLDRVRSNAVAGERIILEQRLPNNIYVSRQLDALERLCGRGHLAPSRRNMLMTEERNYYKRGERTSELVSSERFGINGNLTEHIKYSYDKNGNLTEIYENGLLIARYSYDSLNRLVREDSKAFDKTVAYVYDVGGNILRKTEYAYTLGDVKEKTPVRVIPYMYSASSRWRDRMTAYCDEMCEYDTLGRPVVYKDVLLTWDKYGMLTVFGDDVVYAYNGDGIRVAKMVDGVTTKFFLDGAKILRSVIDNGTDIWYNYTVDGIHGLSVTKDGKTTEYVFRRNFQGDVTHIYKQQYNMLSLAARYKYDAWGNCEVEEIDGSGIGAVNPIRYRSYYFDTETGLYYLNARYYDPETGRFISADDTKFLNPDAINGLNLFAYCGNNPVMNIDPSGRSFIATLLIGIIVGAVVGGALNGYFAYSEGARGWDLFGAILGGAVMGAAVGAVAGWIIPAAGSFVGIGAVSVGGGAAAIAATGVEVVVATVAVAASLGIIVFFSKNADRMGRSKIGSNQHYNKMFDDFCKSKGINDKTLRRKFHDFITKKGHDTWEQLKKAWMDFLKRGNK